VNLSGVLRTSAKNSCSELAGTFGAVETISGPVARSDTGAKSFTAS
jgi:hypothetical protein